MTMVMTCRLSVFLILVFGLMGLDVGASSSSTDILEDGSQLSTTQTWREKILEKQTDPAKGAGTTHVGNLTKLPLSTHIEIMEWVVGTRFDKGDFHLDDDALSLNSLLRTCRYFQAFARPILGSTHTIPDDLRSRLLTTIIVHQSGNYSVFIKYHSKDFWVLPPALLRHYVSTRHYNGALCTRIRAGLEYMQLSYATTIEAYDLRELTLTSTDSLLFPNSFYLDKKAITSLKFSVPHVEVASDLRSYPNLKTIEVFHYLDQPKNLRSLGDLRGLVHLETIQVTGDCLERLPPLKGNKSLQKIVAFQNRLTHVGDLNDLGALRDLNLAENHLETFPPIYGLTSLHTLDLSDNRLRSMPYLTTLKNLTELFLGRNQLTVFPDLTGLDHLYECACDFNPFVHIPAFPLLTNLWTLDLESTGLTNVPSLTQLINLEMLCLGNNALDSFPELEVLTKLTALSLQRNKLTQLQGLSNLTNLTFLDIARNHLTAMPDIRQATNLHSLDVSQNRLSRLLDFSNFKALSILEAFENDLMEFPTVQGCTMLHRLELHFNPLQGSFDMGHLTSLKYLSLDRRFIEGLEFLKNMRDTYLGTPVFWINEGGEEILLRDADGNPKLTWQWG